MLFNKEAKVATEKGITGLETAIILIAFVVVASVFAFTVLSTGIFASERSKETVFSGLEEAKSSIEPRGSVIAYKANNAGTNTIYKVSWVVSNAVAGEPVDLTPPYLEGEDATDPDIDSGAEYKTVISYTDINQHLADVPWTVSWVGNNNGDSLLEAGEKAEITAWLLERDTTVAVTDANAAGYWVADANGGHGILSSGTLIGTNDQFTLEMAPESGAVLTIQRTAPSRLDTIMDLK
ncbi:archaellin/type IV pilin N-terminal domain-containing protein [Candidatus Lucifugimonas marina]